MILHCIWEIYLKLFKFLLNFLSCTLRWNNLGVLIRTRQHRLFWVQITEQYSRLKFYTLISCSIWELVVPYAKMVFHHKNYENCLFNMLLPGPNRFVQCTDYSASSMSNLWQFIIIYTPTSNCFLWVILCSAGCNSWKISRRWCLQCYPRFSNNWWHLPSLFEG